MEQATHVGGLIDPHAAYGTRPYAVKWDYRHEGILMLQYES
jgi:hypothetical protein